MHIFIFIFIFPNCNFLRSLRQNYEAIGLALDANTSKALKPKSKGGIQEGGIENFLLHMRLKYEIWSRVCSYWCLKFSFGFNILLYWACILLWISFVTLHNWNYFFSDRILGEKSKAPPSDEEKPSMLVVPEEGPAPEKRISRTIIDYYMPLIRKHGSDYNVSCFWVVSLLYFSFIEKLRIRTRSYTHGRANKSH